MVDSLKSLPPAEEVARVFNDYKAVLKVARYRTPLQRIHRLTTQHCAITYSQKLQTEADRIFNLLPPGLNTVHNVDFLRLLISAVPTVVLRIPVTLLDCGGRYALLRNSEADVVTVKLFKDSEKACAAFEEAIHCSALLQYVHKSVASPVSFHSTLQSALALWTGTSSQQQLQQYIPPVYKSPCCLRVHWSRAWPKPRYYFITSGSVMPSNGLPFLLTAGKSLGRAFSNPSDSGCDVFGQDFKGFKVQKMRKGPELRKELETCLRVLNSSLRPALGLREVVCDFKPTAGRKWVFLKCQGYTVETRMKLSTSFLEQHRVIDLRFLMYPLVANRSLMRSRLKWSNKLKTIATQQAQQTVSVAPDEECVIGSESSVLSHTEPRSEDRNSPTARKRVVVKALLAKGVVAYDRLVQDSRQFKADQQNKANVAERCGGEALWKQHIGAFFQQFQTTKEASDFFAENLSIDEASMITCSMLRVVRGDYNFYYKEALKKVHHRLKIPAPTYSLFLSGLHKYLETVTECQTEAAVVLRRFQQLQEYICAPAEGKKGPK